MRFQLEPLWFFFVIGNGLQYACQLALPTLEIAANNLSVQEAILSNWSISPFCSPQAFLPHPTASQKLIRMFTSASSMTTRLFQILQGISYSDSSAYNIGLVQQWNHPLMHWRITLSSLFANVWL